MGKYRLAVSVVGLAELGQTGRDLAASREERVSCPLSALQSQERLELGVSALGTCLEQIVQSLVLGVDHLERQLVQEHAHHADCALDCLGAGLSHDHHDPISFLGFSQGFEGCLIVAS